MQSGGEGRKTKTNSQNKKLKKNYARFIFPKRSVPFFFLGWQDLEWRFQPLWEENPCASPGPVCPLLLKIPFCAQTLWLKFGKEGFSNTIPGLGSPSNSICPFGGISQLADGGPVLSTRKFLRQSLYIGKSHRKHVVHPALLLSKAVSGRCVFRRLKKRKSLSTTIPEVTLLFSCKAYKKRSILSPQFALL